MRRGFVIGSLMIVSLAGLAGPRPGRTWSISFRHAPRSLEGARASIEYHGSAAPPRPTDVFNTWVPSASNLHRAQLARSSRRIATQEPSTATPQTQNYVYFRLADRLPTKWTGGSVYGLTDFNPNGAFTGSDRHGTQFNRLRQSYSYANYAPPSNLPFEHLDRERRDSYGGRDECRRDDTGSSVGSGSNTSFTIYDSNTGSTNVSYSLVRPAIIMGMVSIAGSVVPEPASIVIGLDRGCVARGPGRVRPNPPPGDRSGSRPESIPSAGPVRRSP